MAATLVVTPWDLGSRAPIARVSCADCGGAIHFDVDTPRLRRLVARLARMHVCAVVPR